MWKEVVLLGNPISFEFLCKQKVLPDTAFVALRRAAKKELVAKRDSEKLNFKPAEKNLGKKPNSAHIHHCPVEISSKKAGSLDRARNEHKKAGREYVRCKTIFDEYLFIYAGVPEEYNTFFYVGMNKRNKPDIFFGPLDEKGNHMGHYTVDFNDGTVIHVREIAAST